MEGQEDQIELKILKCLYWSGNDFSKRPTYWQISKDTGVNLKVISNKMEKMKTEGFFLGVTVMIDPGILKLKRKGFLGKIDGSFGEYEENLLKNCEFIYGYHILNMEMDLIFLDVIYEHESSLNEYVKKLQSLIPQINIIEEYESYLRDIVPDRRSLSIMNLLSENPFIPVNDIATKIEISSGKVKKYMQRLCQKECMSFVVSLSSYRNLFANVSEIFIKVRDGKKEEFLKYVSREVAKNIVYKISNFKNLIIMGLDLNDLGQSNKIMRKIKSFSGEIEANLYFPFKMDYSVPEILKSKLIRSAGMVIQEEESASMPSEDGQS